MGLVTGAETTATKYDHSYFSNDKRFNRVSSLKSYKIQQQHLNLNVGTLHHPMMVSIISGSFHWFSPCKLTALYFGHNEPVWALIVDSLPSISFLPKYVLNTLVCIFHSCLMHLHPQSESSVIAQMHYRARARWSMWRIITKIWDLKSFQSHAINPGFPIELGGKNRESDPGKNSHRWGTGDRWELRRKTWQVVTTKMLIFLHDNILSRISMYNFSILNSR